MKKNKISVVIPVYKLNDITLKGFHDLIKSINNQKQTPEEIVFVVPNDDTYSINAINSVETTLSTKIIYNEGKTDFQSQMNLGVSNATSEWISMAETDDVYSPIWFKNVNQYIDAYSDVELFLPIIAEVNETGKYIALCNETCWAQSFSDELGVLTNDALLDYHNFNIGGFVIKKSSYNDFGGLKSNMKLTFIYEFLLRMTFNGAKTMVIPKVGYRHTNNRPDSLFRNIRETMSNDENKFWWTQARKDYFFNTDREIKYTKTDK